MIVDFRDPDTGERGVSAETVVRQYQLQMDILEHCQTQQFKQNSLYLKLFGLFAFLSGICFVLQSKGTFPNFLVGIVVVGVGTLSVMFMHAFFLHPGWDQRVRKCISDGRHLEEKYPEVIPTKLFHELSGLQVSAHRAATLGRFVPFALILILTAISSVTLAMKAGIGLAMGVGIFSAALLIASAFFQFTMSEGKEFT